MELCIVNRVGKICEIFGSRFIFLGVFEESKVHLVPSPLLKTAK